MTSFETFKETFKGEIVDSSSPDYENAISRWAGNAVRKARYVVYPKDAEDVSRAIKYSVANNITFVVKGGGHNPSGASSVEDGLVIDLNKHFNYANVDPVTKTVEAGGGALWNTVDYAAFAHGLATVGGTVNLTGIGGYCTGGGHGILTGKHGESSDNILEMTVVIADGSILIVNENSYPDLFWALRGGGGGNYGCVTRFKLRLYDQKPTVYAGMLIFTPAQFEQVTKTFDEWILGITEDDCTGLGFTRGPDGSPMVMMVVFHNGSGEQGRQRYKVFFDIGPVVDMTREMPYPQANELFNPTSGRFRRYYMTGTSLRGPIVAHAREAYEKVLAVTEKNPCDEKEPPFEVAFLYEIFDLKKVMSVPPDATAFRNRGKQHQILISVAWDKEMPGDTEYARTISRELVAIVERTGTTQPKEYETDFYGNYTTDITVSAVSKAERLWGANLPRLQEVKEKYDPTRVFNNWIAIPPRSHPI